jgi:hypothetical protein
METTDYAIGAGSQAASLAICVRIVTKLIMPHEDVAKLNVAAACFRVPGGYQCV